MNCYWYIDLDTMLKLVLAVILGGAIGFERERHGRDAGLRTHIIVALASTLILIAGQYLADIYQSAMGGGRTDPGRIAAGIVTGIGFLGAGTILRMRDAVRGLTTAACVWFVAGIGIVVGVGCFGLAIAGTVVALLALFVLKEFEKRIDADCYGTLTVKGKSTEQIIGGLQKLSVDLGVRLRTVTVDEDRVGGTSVVSALIRYRKRLKVQDVVARAREMPDVLNISWDQPRLRGGME